MFLSGRLQELKNKGKVQLGNSKSAHGRRRSFTEVVATTAGRLREWSQAELRLQSSFLRFTD